MVGGGGGHAHPNAHMELSPVPTGMEGEEEVLVALKRRVCRECLQSFPERLATQEVERLMQMLTEDEHGMVHIEDLGDQLEHLRMEALLNSLVETDVFSLRAHLIPRFKSMGVTADGNIKVWKLKPALLQAESICLSRLQTHVLLCLAEPDDDGFVDLSTYMASLSVVIPHMCDAKIFVETAERLQIEHADATRRNENAELAALGAAQVDQLRQEDGEEKHQESEADQETVERTLIQVLSVLDKEHNGMLQPEVIWNVLTGGDAQVQGLGLSEFETYGLAAEMTLDDNGLVAYHDHVRRWVPIIFEVRKSPLLGGYLKEDSAETLGIPEPSLDELEKIFPTMERQSRVEAGGSKEPRDSLDAAHEGRASSKSENEHRASILAGARLGGRIHALHGDQHHGHHGHHDKHGEGHGHGHHGQHGHHGHHAGHHHHHHGRSMSKTGMDCTTAKDPPPGRGYARRSIMVIAARTSMQDDARSQASVGSKDAVADNIMRANSKDSIVHNRSPEGKPMTPGYPSQ
jgi:Ca2+-binding EF-hand superfamily protein/ribosomal protein L15